MARCLRLVFAAITASLLAPAWAATDPVLEWNGIMVKTTLPQNPFFQARFAAPIERDRNREAQRVLRRLIAPFVLRRTKAQVLDDLPPQVEQVVTVESGAEERAHYEAVRRQALAAVEQAVASDAPVGASAG